MKKEINKKELFKKQNKKNNINKEKIKVKKKNETNKSKEKKHMPLERKKIIITLISATIIILIFLAIVYLTNMVMMNLKYKKYEEKMDLYGFSNLYNNESSKTNESVTKLDVVKQALGSIYNVYDATYIGYQPNGEFEGDEWVKTAVLYGMLKEGKITAKNYNEKATYWDFIELILNVRAKKLKVEVAYNKESNFKNLGKYNQDKQRYINDLVENDLIGSDKGKIKLDSKVIKGQVNEIVIRMAEKYGTILKEGETLVTKKESMPSNYKLYPYIIYSIPNEVYEKKHVNQDKKEYKSPAELYKYRKEYYDQIDYRITKFYNKILNIDYKTIDIEEFKKEIREYTLYMYEDSDYEAYINHVKENKITIEGTADVLEPIIYFDSVDIRARAKLTFEIKSSDTDKNILFGDMIGNKENTITYKSKKYTIYVDVPVSKALNVVSYFIEVRPVKNIIADAADINTNTL